MAQIPLGITAFKRDHARSPESRVINRYYEKNPFNQQDQVSLIIRPSLQNRLSLGAGPIRRMAYQQGVFNNDMFVVSGPDLFRLHKDYDPLTADTFVQISGLIDGGNATPDIAITEEYVFIADGYNLHWTDGVAALAPVTIPDNKAIASIDVIAGYVIVVLANSDQFYWIPPGSNTIDPLDFATAERLPDWVLQVRTIGDQFWLLGQQSTEVWYPSGDPLSPFQRAQGRIFDQGIWGGTAVKIKDVVMVVANDGQIIKIGAGPEPVSTPGITERVKKAMIVQEQYGS
jgi:hypothetical protein